MSENPSAYDEVAYPSPILPELLPERLRAEAILHGFDASPAATARLLEIGCGDGLNLIAHTALNPQGFGTGFDLSAAAVARGRAEAELAEVEHVELSVDDIATFPVEGETYDYITCHGVLTWVPDALRPRIIEIIAGRLAPGGVAYLGYDCTPASGMKSMLVPFLRERARANGTLSEKVHDAVAAIAMLSRNQAADSLLKPQLEQLVEDLPRFEEGYFYHDWLAEHYAPLSLDWLMEQAGQNGLAVAGSIGNYDLSAFALDGDGAALFDATADDPGERLLTIEMLTGPRNFHRDILVRRGHPPLPVGERFRRLSYAFDGTREPVDEVTAGMAGAYRYSVRERVFVVTAHPDIKAVLDCLYEASPNELGYDALRVATGLSDTALDDALAASLTRNILAAHSTPQPFTATPGERPCAFSVARRLAAHGYAINLRGHRVALEPGAARCLMLCDGTHTRDEIAAALSVEAGRTVTRDMLDPVLAQGARRRLFEA